MSMLPFNIVPINSDINKQLLKDFTGERKGFLQAGAKKYVLPYRYKEEAYDYYNFNLRSDDIWVATYPRSGTTLTQELVWLIENNLDFNTAKNIPLVKRFPFFEGSIQSDNNLIADVLKLVKGNPGLEQTANRYGNRKISELNLMKNQRFIKTHLPFSLLPQNLLNTCKVIYVARYPKDVVVSYYYHNRLFKTLGYIGNFEKYYNYFENNLLPWSPYWEHVKEAWNKRNNPNLLFIFYEDLVGNAKRTVIRVAEFLGKHDFTEGEINKLVEHLKFENFRKNPSTNLDAEALPGLRVPGEQTFIRKGKIGGWKNDVFTQKLSERADQWIQHNLQQIPDLQFPHY